MTHKFPKAFRKDEVKDEPKDLIPSKFFHFRQNNSFGRFHYDHTRGISVHVIVEADDYEAANSKAEQIGLYFDGGGDCPCCGNRWSEQYEYSGKDSSDPYPAIYGTRALGLPVDGKTEFDGYIHYKTGLIEGVNPD